MAEDLTKYLTNLTKEFNQLLTDQPEQRLIVNTVRSHLNELYERLTSFDFSGLTFNKAKTLFTCLNEFIQTFNRLGQRLSKLTNADFWAVWNKTASELENLFDGLDFYTDTESQNLTKQIINGTYDKKEFVRV